MNLFKTVLSLKFIKKAYSNVYNKSDKNLSDKEKDALEDAKADS